MAKTVLIVEDNELNMKLFNDLVETRGHRIVQTRSGVEAVELARKHRPDLILMDIQLPEVSGLEVTQWLKDDEELRAIPGHRRDRVRDEGRRGKNSAGRLRGLSVQADFGREVLRDDRSIPWAGSQAMTARVLVVDDIPANLKLLEARLSIEYFEVLTATNGPDAIAICEKGRLRHRPARRDDAGHGRLRGLPAIESRVGDRPSADRPRHRARPAADRVRGLEAGADDFLTKPIDEIALIARVRSLARLKFSIDELRSRAAHSAATGAVESVEALKPEAPERGRILLVDDQRSSFERLVKALTPHHDVIRTDEPGEALAKASSENVDLMIVSLGLEAFDGLRLCSQVRSQERTRNLPILLIADREDRQKVLRGLELGVNDYLSRPVDRNELLARVRTNVRQKRYGIDCAQTVRRSMEMALYDPLTGLNNRRFLERHLPTMIDAARQRGAPLTMMILDIDHFKRINDTYGHDAGDRRAQGLRLGAATDRPRRRPGLPAGRGGICRRHAGPRCDPCGADGGARAPSH